MKCEAKGIKKQQGEWGGKKRHQRENVQTEPRELTPVAIVAVARPDCPTFCSHETTSSEVVGRRDENKSP